MCSDPAIEFGGSRMKRKLRDCLFKYEEFPQGDNRTFTHVQGFPRRRTLHNYMGHELMSSGSILLKKHLYASWFLTKICCVVEKSEALNLSNFMSFPWKWPPWWFFQRSWPVFMPLCEVGG